MKTSQPYCSFTGLAGPAGSAGPNGTQGDRSVSGLADIPGSKGEIGNPSAAANKEDRGPSEKQGATGPSDMPSDLRTLSKTVQYCSVIIEKSGGQSQGFDF